MGKSTRLAIILAGARVFCLGMLALLLTLPCDSSVGAAVNFGFSGFQENSLHFVLESSWIFDTTTGCFYFDPPTSSPWYSISGRFLLPGAVQMIDPGSTTVKSFSTSFIYQLRIMSDDGYTGPGMAFLIVPDNVTVGAPLDFMGLITNGTSEFAKNYESDDHTLGVELDTFPNPEFNDPNENHIGINLASMNSTYSFKPVYSLASSSADLFQQIWIDYFESDSRMDIYYANYKQGKPAKPQGSKSGLNLSLLKESMYIGFSTAKGIESSNVPYVCAWSFSNNGNPAPSIVIAQDATPGAPPPPAAVPPSPPGNGPVAAPSLPPPAPLASPPPVPTRSPAPGNASPPPPPASNPPPFRAPNPSPFNPPNPPPASSVPSQGEPPTITEKGGKKKNLWMPVGVPVSALTGSAVMIICIIVSLCWCRFVSRPLRIFISHAGGPDGSQKNFPTWLDETMRKYRWSVAESRVRIFFDTVDIEMGKSIAKRILRELERFDVGVVVVTEAFFVAKWPMTELIAFVEAQMNDPTDRIRVLPLFYELSPEQVRAHLGGKIWEANWEKMSTGNHPLEVEKCRAAVTWLCKQRGIPYGYINRHQDRVYIEKICMEVDRILCKERSFASYLIGAVKTCCVPSCSKPGITIHETEMPPPCFYPP